MHPGIARVVVAGLLGTLVMTAVGLFAAPMMGMPLFSGSMAMAGGSLIGHLMYGAVLGGVTGTAVARQPA